jgi:hypothetical protein
LTASGVRLRLMNDRFSSNLAQHARSSLKHEAEHVNRQGKVPRRSGTSVFTASTVWASHFR